MKRLLIRFLMLVPLAGAVCSCGKDNPVSGPDDLAVIRFQVNSDLALRSLSDEAAEAVQLIVGVFDEAGNPFESLKTVVDGDGSAFFFELSLTPSETYNVVFFAQAPDAFVDSESFTAESLKAIPLGGHTLLNKESDDVFVAVRTIVPEDFSYPVYNVTLTRAWAQLNIAGTGTVSDIDAVSVSLSGLPETYNAFTGEASGSRDVVFTGGIAGGTIEVDEQTYNHIAFIYIPVGNDPLSVNPVLTLSRGASDDVYAIESVPLKANYRTNILGAL